MIATPGHQYRRRFFFEWVFLLVALLTFGAYVAYSQYQEYVELGVQERERLVNSASVVERNLAPQLHSANKALESVRNELPLWQMGKDRGAWINSRLQVLAETLPELRILLVVDANGKVTASNNQKLMGADISNREWFQLAARGNAPDTLYLTAPIKSLLNTYAMGLVRSFSGPDGKFYGAVYASLNPDFAKTLLDSVRYTPDISTSLIHGDGKVFAIMPESEGLVGKDMATPDSLFTRHRNSGQSASLFFDLAGADGNERMMALRTVQPAGLRMDKPLVVTVSRDVKTAFSPWHRGSGKQGWMFGLLTMIAGLSMYFYQRRQRRLDQVADNQAQALRASTDRLNEAQRISQVGSWTLELSSGKLSWSDEIFRLFEIDPDRFEATYEAFLNAVHPQDRQAVNQLYADSLENRMAYEVTHRLLMGDGRIKWVHERGVSDFDAAGKPLRSRGTVQDITERVKAEMALSKERDFADIASDAQPDTIFVFESATGKAVRWNKAFRDISGYADEEIATLKAPDSYYDHDDLAKMAAARAAASVSGVLHAELSLVCKNGRRVATEYSGSFIPDQNESQKYMICVGRDITERKKQEEHVRQLLVENETVLSHVQVGIAFIKQRRIVSCNRRLEEVFQYEPGELIGVSTEQLFDTPANYRAYGEIGYVVLSEARSYSRELMLRHKDGSLFWGAATGSAIDPAQPNDGSIWVYADISERKQMEQQLGEHQSRLEELVLKRTHQLNEALEAAKVSDRSKDEFLANITHELRTPLSAVIGFSSLARPFCKDARQSEYLDKVKSAGNTLSAIIDDLLDLSKIAAGRLELEKRPFSLRQLVARSRSVISFKTEEKGLELVARVDAAVPDVFVGDSLRIEQILLNLLNNAVKFTAAGRVELRIGVQANEKARVCLKLEVTDTGKGMTDADLELLFKPFSQTDASMTRRYGGTGLGLSICRRLAELMGGDISVTSREGAGSSFCVKLWLDLGADSDVPVAEESVPEAAQVCYQDARVLVVDDQLFNREVVQGLLAVVGIVPQLASDGQEALDILSGSAETFDLVLMDIQMPLMDGLAATREIRSWPGFAQLPIISMTAHTMTHERAKSTAAGMNDHIGKPFDEAGFYRVLAKWIPREKQHQLAAPIVRAASSNGLPPLQGVDTKAGLALLQGDEARYRHWLNNFVTEAPVAVAQIRQALAAANPEPASMAAHSLKGRTGLLGMKGLYAIAAALEAAIDSAAPSAELLLNLERDVAVMCEELGRELGPVATAEPVLPAGPPPGPLPDSVARLIANLEVGDSDCDRLVAACLAELADTAWVPCLRQVLVHVQGYDYAAAGSLLSGNRQASAGKG